MNKCYISKRYLCIQTTQKASFSSPQAATLAAVTQPDALFSYFMDAGCFPEQDSSSLGKEEGWRYLCEVLQSGRAVGNRRRDRHPDCPIHGGLVLHRWSDKSTWEPHGLWLESIVPCTCDIWHGRRDTVMKVKCWKIIALCIFKRVIYHYLELWRSLYLIYFSYEYNNTHEGNYTALGGSDASHKTKPNKF